MPSSAGRRAGSHSYTVRSERQLMEQLGYNLLFRWFVGLIMDDPIGDATTFTKNRRRLLDGDIAQAFFEFTVGLPGPSGGVGRVLLLRPETLESRPRFEQRRRGPSSRRPI
jgi:transposase-like protein DUF772